MTKTNTLKFLPQRRMQDREKVSYSVITVAGWGCEGEGGSEPRQVAPRGVVIGHLQPPGTPEPWSCPFCHHLASVCACPTWLSSLLWHGEPLVRGAVRGLGMLQQAPPEGGSPRGAGPLLSPSAPPSSTPLPLLWSASAPPAELSVLSSKNELTLPRHQGPGVGLPQNLGLEPILPVSPLFPGCSSVLEELLPPRGQWGRGGVGGRYLCSLVVSSIGGTPPVSY